MNKKLLSVMSATALLGTLAVGCGTSGNNSSASNGNSGSTGASNGVATNSASGTSSKPLEIGVVSISTQDWLNEAVIKGIQKVAASKGWKVDVVNANGSAQDANSAIQTFVNKKVDGIVDLVFPTSSLSTGLQAAQNAGIPVETWGGGLGNGVAATNGDGGPFAVPVVQKMIQAMNGKGSILALTYHTGRVAQQRETEFDKIVAAYPNIKVTKEEVSIPGDFQSGYNYAVAWLSSHPKGSGNLAIWGAWDDPALGAASAVKQQGRTDVKIYGENGEPSVLQSIKDGVFTAVDWENGVAEGQQLANLLPQIIAAGKSWTPKTYSVPGVLVDKSNVDSFMASHPGGYAQ